MKKTILIMSMMLLVAGTGAGIYGYAPARTVVQDGWQRYGMPAWGQAEKWALDLMNQMKVWVEQLDEKWAQWTVEGEAAPAPQAVEPQVTPAPAPQPAPTPAPEPAPAPAPEPAPEPTPLPALNAEAAELVSKAEAGDAVAQFNLARLYVLGEGMAINKGEFMRWCRTAADQGLPEAQFTLGCCYRRGIGVEQNEAEGRRLLEAAAAAGYAPATQELQR